MYVKRLMCSNMKIRAFVNDLAKLFVILVVMNMEMNLGNVVRVHLPFLFHSAKGNSSVEEYKIWKRLLKLYAPFYAIFLGACTLTMAVERTLKCFLLQYNLLFQLCLYHVF